MNQRELDDYLRKLDPIEEIQVVTRQNLNDLDGKEFLYEKGQCAPRMKEDYFFHNGPIFISKHHRFADMPVHIHDFIEINYVYSGQCRQVINGKNVTLKEGQVCLLDIDVPHTIPALEENDILINIIMKKETFSTHFLSRLKNTSIVSNFLMNVVAENTRHDHYILFYSQDNENLQYTIKNMLCEYFDKREYALDMVNYYIPVMFTELMRVYQLDKNFEIMPSAGKAKLLDILQYIELNYHNCSLTSLAEHFNFNPNYLSNMLKERTGSSFVELIQLQRMLHASSLLKNTDKSIEDIASEIGYESLSYFYKKFRDHFGITPRVFRQKRT